MGCCISTPSSRVITSSQSPSQAGLSRTSNLPTSHCNQHETQNINKDSASKKNLQRFVWSSTDRIWTNVELERERTDFFDTRTSGRPEVWQTLKAVLEILWTSQDAEETTDSALSTAQQILDAAEIIVPHSTLSPGVYDSFGAYYPIPKYILAFPTNVVMVSTADKSEPERNECLDEDEAIRRREEKGKSVIKPVDLTKLRVKLSDRDAAPIQLLIGREDSARLVALKISEEAGLPPSKTIRIAYMGKILKDNLPLQAQGWKEENVINALIFG